MMVSSEWMWLSEVKYSLVLTWRPGEETPDEYLGFSRFTHVSSSSDSASMFRCRSARILRSRGAQMPCAIVSFSVRVMPYS